MKVVFLDTVHPILEERLTNEGFQCVDATKSDLETCHSLVHDAVGIVIRSRFPMDESFLKHADKLQFIARSGAGMENIDAPYCDKRNIQLFNAPEGNRNAVGEHALGMLLALLNKFIPGDKQVRQGIWDREGNRGEELDSKTVGIIGYGNNGRAFAKKLRGFECKVLVYDKYLPTIGDDFVIQVSLEQLYQEADVISFHIPQNEETRYWVNDAFFAALGKPIYLLNLSRGKIVDTQALLKAISTSQVKGAGLDVLEFEKASFENFSDSERLSIFQALIASDKVILTPHIGGWTTESYYKLSDVLADKILAFYR
jgi:D-3-phosphoglycerate dehydrogenase